MQYKTLFALVIAIFLVVCPWVTYMKIWSLQGEEQKVFEQYGGYAYDFFIHYKAELIIAMAIFLILVMIGENIFPKYIEKNTPIRNKNNKNIYLCMMVYAAFVIVSSIFSKHETIAKNGTYSQGEGYWVLLSYAVLCLGAMNYFCYEKALQIFQRAMTVLCIITIILTMIEFFYRPLLTIPIAKYFVTSKEFYSIVEGMKTTGYSDFVALTFYNPNYYGGFCMLLFPFAFYEYLNAKEKWAKIGYLFLSVGMFFCELSAKSTTSFYLVCMEIFVFLFMHKKMSVRLLKSAGVWIVTLLLLCTGFNAASHGKVWEIGQSVLINKSTANTQELIFRLTDIKLEGNRLALCGEKDNFFVEAKEGGIQFFDTEEKVLDYEIGEYGAIYFTDKRYEAISLSYKNELLIFDLGYDGKVDFYLIDDVFYGIGQQGEKLTSVSVENRFGSQWYHLFTGRGYVWCLSAKLLPETFLIGKGPGNFAFYCTQNDYVGLLNTHGSHYSSMDKPHSLYLQMWIDIGGIAVFALLAFMCIVLLRYCKWKKSAQSKQCAKVYACADWLIVSFGAFIIYSALNDSLVAVTFVICIFSGILLTVTNTQDNDVKN